MGLQGFGHRALWGLKKVVWGTACLGSGFVVCSGTETCCCVRLKKVEQASRLSLWLRVCRVQDLQGLGCIGSWARRSLDLGSWEDFS